MKSSKLKVLNIKSEPPNSIESEQAVIASVLIDPKAIDEVIGFINAEDFYHPTNVFIFDTLLELNRMNNPVDLITLTSRLNDLNGLDKAGGMSYLTSLMQIVPNAANILSYATIIRNKSVLRAMISAGSDISNMGYNLIDPLAELIEKAQSIVYNISADRGKSAIDHIQIGIENYYKSLEDLYNSDNKDINGISTGFADLDTLTNGLQDSDLIIVAGRPGMGKTSFGLNMLYNIASQGKSAVFFSLEMSTKQLINRLISSEAEIESSKLRTGNFNESDWKKIGDFSAKISKLDIYLDDTSSITVNQIRSKCRRLKSKNKLDVIFVDYLQLMGYDKSIIIREQQISDVSRSLKALAKELNIPIVAFAQVNRAVEHRTDSKPLLSDLRESGAIEQDADIIMFIYRDVVYNPDSLLKDTAELYIAKHRNGATGTVYLSYIPKYTQFGKMPVAIDYIRSIKESKRSSKSGSKKD